MHNIKGRNLAFIRGLYRTGFVVRSIVASQWWGRGVVLGYQGGPLGLYDREWVVTAEAREPHPSGCGDRSETALLRVGLATTYVDEYHVLHVKAAQ